jgi:hypothetical protein
MQRTITKYERIALVDCYQQSRIDKEGIEERKGLAGLKSILADYSGVPSDYDESSRSFLLQVNIMTRRLRRSEFRCKVGTETRTFGISKEEMHGVELLWVHNPVLHMLINVDLMQFFSIPDK